MAKKKTATRKRAAGGDKAAGVKQVPASKKQNLQQTYLDPDMAPKRVEAIDSKGAALIEAIDNRKHWLEQAQAAKQVLIELMIEHHLEDYMLEVDTRQYKLELSKETKVSARKLKVLPEGG